MEGALDGEKEEASARAGSSRVMEVLLGCTQPGCAILVIFAPPACPPPHRENGRKRREGAGGKKLVRDSERGDVIECVVQLLADGLVLHLLCIDFIWVGGIQGWVGVWGEGIEGKRKGRSEGNKKRE